MNPVSQKLSSPQKGFALVVAMTLVSFVILMLLSLGAMVSVELSLAGQHVIKERARINALTGLSIALGELQAVAGDDQRVTAPADILSARQSIDDEKKLITGVWKSGDYSGAAGPELTMTERWNWSVGDDSTVTDSGAWSSGPRWLVSSENPITNLATESWNSLSPTLRTAPMVISEGRTTAGEPSGTQVETLAGIVPLENARGQVDGGYAWWIGDEGIKAKVNPSGAFPEQDSVKARLLNASRAPNVTLSVWDGLEAFSGENAQEVFARSDSPLDLFESGGLTTADAESLAPRYYDHWTTSSYSLVANTRDGGLKKDLTRGLGDEFPETMAGRSLWWFRESGGKYMKGPLWDIVYSYANLYREKMPWIASFLQPNGSIGKAVYNNSLYYNYVNNLAQGWGASGVTDSASSFASLEPRGPMPYADGEKAYLITDNTENAYTGSSRWLYGDNATANKRIPFLGTESVTQTKKAEGIQYVVSPFVLGVVARISLASSKVTHIWDDNLQPVASSKNNPDPDDPYWNRRSIADVFGFDTTAYPDALDDTAVKLYEAGGDKQDFFRQMDSHYVLHVIVDPHVIVWNPYNISLESFRVTLWWFPGYKLDGSKQFENLDWRINTSAGPLMVKAVDDFEEPNGRDYFSLGGLMRSGDRQSGVNANNTIKLQVDVPDGEYLAAGEIRAFSMLNPSSGGVNTIALQSDEGASEISGVLSAPLFSPPIPEGTKIEGIELRTDIANDGNYTTESWEMQPKLARVNSDTADLQDNPNKERRALMIATSVPEGGGGSSIVHEYETAPTIEELNPTLGVNGPASDGGGSLKSDEPPYQDVIATAGDAHKIAYLSAFAQPANIASNKGLPLFAQFNPAAQAFLETTEQNSNAFLWKVELLDPEGADSALGLTSVIDGNPGWGADFGLNGEQNIALFDIPRYPLQSVGALMHANLGLYDVNPAYAVGSGYANPLVPIEGSYVTRDLDTLDDNNAVRFYLPDSSYHLNEAIFDEYFFSTIPEASSGARGFRNTGRTPPFDVDFDEDYLTDGGALPNPRMTIVSGETDPDVLRDFDNAARHLMIDGAFNINSTSKPAWKAFLSGLNSVEIENIASGSKSHTSDFPQMRSALPYSDSDSPWNGYKALTEAELDSLAEAIVTEVRLRGPFLSLSDFVNRRLVDDDTGKIAALQGAIDKTVNLSASDLGGAVAYQPTGDWAGNFDPTVLASKQGAGAPGWLLQQDVLKTMAPLMTARSDTFTIRAYGSTVNPVSGEVDTEVWCEALVQRFPDYVPEADGLRSDPTEAVWTKEWGSGHEWEASVNAKVGQLAARFGREFRIIKFRWLSPSEVDALSGS